MAHIIKKNTTPTIDIKINGVTSTQIKKVILGFKEKDSENYPLLLRKETNKIENTMDGGSKISVTLTTEETLLLKEGDIFVDVYPIGNNIVYNTGRPIRYEVYGSFFKEAITS